MLICYDVRTGGGCGAQYADQTAACADPTCGMLLQYALKLHDPAVVIGSYTIVRLIDYGAFGAVYEARQSPGGATVALKETSDLSHVRTFQAELQALRQLRHPHLPQYHEAFEQDGHGYLVMELVPGQNLAGVLAPGGAPLIEGQLLGYAVQLCDVLDYLHASQPPIFHRDIKPANIRLTPAGLIKLVDFGLVKVGGHQTRATVQGFGTPEYAPPEQYSGGTSAQSDIYSLGATLYHLATGVEPPSAIARLTAPADPLLSPAQLNPLLSPYVSQAIVTAMALRPDDRHPSASAFRQALFGAPAQPPAATSPTIRLSAAAPGGLGLPSMVSHMTGPWNAWRLRYHETFRDNRASWPQGSIDTQYTHGRRQVGVGRYRWEVEAKSGMYWLGRASAWPELDTWNGFYIAVELQHISGADDAGFGIQLYHQLSPDRGTWYTFLIALEVFRFRIWAGDEWTSLIGWTHSPAIRPGQRNKLGIFVYQQQFTFFINDVYVTDYFSADITSVTPGVGVELFAAGDKGVFDFYSAELRAP